MRIERADEVAAMIDVDDFGYAAVYTPVGGLAVSTTVLLDEGVEIEGTEARSIGGSHTITFLYSDVPSPQRDATVVVTDEDGNETTFRVDYVQENDARIVTVIASKVV